MSVNGYLGRPPSSKTGIQTPKTSSSISGISRNNSDDQLFDFLNSGYTPGDKKTITTQLRSTSPIQTSSPKMRKLNGEVGVQKERSNLILSGNPASYLTFSFWHHESIQGNKNYLLNIFISRL